MLIQIDVLEEASATAKHAVGDVFQDRKGGVWVYGHASGAIDQYAACTIDEAGEIAELTTTTSGAVPSAICIPQVSMTDDYYAWAYRGSLGGSVDVDSVKVLAASNCAADVKLYTTSTAGVLDDATSSADCVLNLRLDAAQGSGESDGVACTAIGILTTNAQDDTL